MDSKNTTQVAILVRSVNESFDFREELAAWVTLKGTTKRIDLWETVMTIPKSKLNLNSMSGVTTDQASSMCGGRPDLVKLSEHKASKAGK